MSGPEEPGIGWDLVVHTAVEAVDAYSVKAGLDLHNNTRFDIAHDVCCALYQAGMLADEVPGRAP